MRLKPSGRVVPVVAIALLLCGGAFALWRRHRAPSPPANAERTWPPLARAGVSVEVLNAGGPDGSARVATLLLRHAGLDVQLSGNAPKSLSDRSRNQVLVRRGDTVGVGRVVEALGDAEIIDAPDKTRLVDLTVLIGKQFKAPTLAP